jgi:hypothetical protein
MASGEECDRGHHRRCTVLGLLPKRTLNLSLSYSPLGIASFQGYKINSVTLLILCRVVPTLKTVHPSCVEVSISNQMSDCLCNSLTPKGEVSSTVQIFHICSRQMYNTRSRKHFKRPNDAHYI